MAAHEQWNDGTTIRLLLLVGRGAPSRRLLSTRLSATGWAAKKESEKMMPTTGAEASLDPWR